MISSLLWLGFIGCMVYFAFFARSKIRKLAHTMRTLKENFGLLSNSMQQQEQQGLKLHDMVRDRVEAFFNPLTLPQTSQLPHAGFAQTIYDQQFLLAALKIASNTAPEHENLLLTTILQHPAFAQQSSAALYGWHDASKHALVPQHCITFSHQVPQIHLTANNLNLDTYAGYGNYFFIANPNIANLLLLSPLALKKLSRHIKQALVFPIYHNNDLFSVSWNQGFADHESNEQHHWRWATGATGNSVLTLTNNSLNTQIVEFNFKTWLMDASPAELDIYFLNQHIHHTLQHDLQISCQLSVPPGSHPLVFAYRGEGKKISGDVRVLNFALTDLCIQSKQNKFQIEKKAAYANLLSTHLNPFSDALIRDTLHKNGFFEVEAHASALHMTQLHQLKTSRYHVTNGYYELTDSNPTLHFNHDVTWYIAKRGASLQENQHG